MIPFTSMATPPKSAGMLRFGVFEVELRAGELRKDGLKVRLQEQPFRVLALLLKKPGEVVTREELREKLSSADTYVDFDKSLNTTVNKLREALSDSAENPRFVQTLHRRGYRFIAPVEELVRERSAVDQRAALRPEGAGAPGTKPAAESHIGRSQRFHQITLLAVGSLLGAVVGIVAWQALHSTEPAIEAPLRRFSFTPGTDVSEPVISPNGRHIAYLAAGKLWVQDLDRNEPREIEGADGIRGRPSWSPDSEPIAFFVGDELRKVAVHGGPAIKLLDRHGSSVASVWSPDGSSIFIHNRIQRVLYEVGAQGGSQKRVLTLSVSGPFGPSFPHLLPHEESSRSLVFGTSPPAQIQVQNLETRRREVLASGRRPFYSPTGHIVYEQAQDVVALWALPFSPKTLRATGEPFPINETGSSPSVADDGTLVYLDASGTGLQQLTWRDRSGRKLGVIGQPQAEISRLALSPDGGRVAVTAWENDNVDVWLHDIGSGLTTQLTLDPAADGQPIWSPHGDMITFVSWRKGRRSILIKAADGAGEAKELLDEQRRQPPEYGYGWSSDGEYLVFHRAATGTRSDIWYLQREEGKAEYEAFPFLETPADEQQAALSPDARFLAYESNASGRYEVWVQSFPEGAGKWQVSTEGGRRPRWRGDGNELFYLKDSTLMAVAVTRSPVFSTRGEKPLFEDTGLRQGFDVSADGQRFVVVETIKEPDPPTIRVVENWYEEFRNDKGGR